MRANAAHGTRLVVIVDFLVKTGSLQTFLSLVRENARISLSDEEACHVFEVLTPSPEDGRSVLLYEVYDDADAFSRHLETHHFLQFDADTRDMVDAKSVRRFTMLTNDGT